MNDTTTNHNDELQTLREQLLVQQQLLAEKETLLNQHATDLDHKQSELERKQLLLDESIEHIAWLEETVALLKSKRYRHSSEKLDALQGRLFDEGNKPSVRQKRRMRNRLGQPVAHPRNVRGANHCRITCGVLISMWMSALKTNTRWGMTGNVSVGRRVSNWLARSVSTSSSESGVPNTYVRDKTPTPKAVASR